MNIRNKNFAVGFLGVFANAQMNIKSILVQNIQVPLISNNTAAYCNKIATETQKSQGNLLSAWKTVARNRC